MASNAEKGSSIRRISGFKAKTLANAVYLMEKYRGNAEIYQDLGILLMYFAVPYTFHNCKYILDKQAKEKCHCNISNGILPGLKEIQILEKQTKRNLLLFFQKYSKKYSHPSILVH